jgi:ADP-ribose pyrophosphatase YjhB (NUDIX family)
LYEEQTKTGSKFIRPLGGHIELGEYAVDAVKREIDEELHTAVTNVTQLAIIENIFGYDGKLFHEYVFLFRATLVDTSLYDKPHVPFYEGEMVSTATWYDIAALRQSPIPVVPVGVMEECVKMLGSV